MLLGAGAVPFGGAAAISGIYVELLTPCRLLNASALLRLLPRQCSPKKYDHVLDGSARPPRRPASGPEEYVGACCWLATTNFARVIRALGHSYFELARLCDAASSW